MKYRFRVSVEGRDVERVVGELLTIRADFDLVMTRAIMLQDDDIQIEARDLSKNGWWIADYLDVVAKPAQQRLEVLLDYLMTPEE